MVAGIVLAAGASSRMGSPKALLRAGDRTFVARILASVDDGGVSPIVVVTRPDEHALAAEVSRTGVARVVENLTPELGQLSSLITGLDAIERSGVTAALVTLVDVPMVSAATVRALLDRGAASGASILRAVHRGRHGHPVLFKREVFAALRSADPAIGAKALMRTVEVEDVDVDDPGVTEDVDTPADYERLARMLSQ